jgi:acyl dehydratase
MVQTESQSQERVYEWEEMEIGHDAPPLAKEITKELISNYARSMEDEAPEYQDDGAAKALGFGGVIAPPGMLFQIGPMRRLDIMHARGYISPEEKKVNPRATPFTGTEINFQPIPIRAGDVITSVTRIANRWESRSGNRFVSFGITAQNQRGETILDYYYTVLWEYSKGQKSRSANAAAAPKPPEPDIATGKVIGSETDFADIQLNDTLPGLTNQVTQDLIDDYIHMDRGGTELSPAALLHVDTKFAEATVFAGTTQGGPQAVAYVIQMLAAGLGLKRLMNGTTFNERALEPVRPGDEVSYAARVLEKREETGKQVVDFEVTGTNQLGQTTSAAKVVVNW